MSRAKDKQSLLDSSHDNYQKLFMLIESFGEDEIINGCLPFEDRDKNIRDIVIHLHHWHLMFLGWYKVGMRGDKPDMPAKGYTWRDTALLNQMIWEQYQSTDYYTAVRLLDDSFLKVQDIIEQHSDEEIFTKKYYAWTGTTSLGSYLTSATASHYDWAIKKLKKYRNLLNN